MRQCRYIRRVRGRWFKSYGQKKKYVCAHANYYFKLQSMAVPGQLSIYPVTDYAYSLTSWHQSHRKTKQEKKRKEKEKRKKKNALGPDSYARPINSPRDPSLLCAARAQRLPGGPSSLANRAPVSFLSPRADLRASHVSHDTLLLFPLNRLAGWWTPAVSPIGKRSTRSYRRGVRARRAPSSVYR